MPCSLNKHRPKGKKMKFTVIKKEGTARRGVFETVHGTVQTPAFMNVATCGAIKGAVSSYDLKDIHCQVQLCNTYHLHLRPGDELVKEFGGLHKFTGWDGPILTDSGGFQVFSLAKLRKIKEEGVYFSSRTSARLSLWHLTSASRIPQNMSIPSSPAHARRVGLSAARRRWIASILCPIR